MSEKVYEVEELEDVMIEFGVLTNLPIYLNKRQIGSDAMNQPYENGMRYLKGIYTNKERFIENIVKPMLSVEKKFIDNVMTLEDTEDEDVTFEYEKFDHIEKSLEYFTFSKIKETTDYMLDMYDKVEPFTYQEAFELSNSKSKEKTTDEFQARVWESIDVREMFRNLGGDRIHTDGVETEQNFYDTEGNVVRTGTVSNVYEVYEINTKSIGGDGINYAVKCWCTTTNEEHWLWIEEKYKNDPLEAIASTCRVHEKWIDKLSAIKRQGDIFLFEFKEKPELGNEGPLIPLNKDQYFGLLKAQA